MKPPEFLANRRYGVGIGVLFLLAFLNARFRPLGTGDTEALLSGARVALDCLHRDLWRGCGPGVIHFPLFQYLSGGLWLELGHSVPSTLRFLAVLSGLAFAGIFLLSVVRPWQAGRRLQSLAMSLFLLVSPLPFYYARSSFNESMAAFVTLAYAYSLLRSESFLLVLLTGFLTGITKEIAPPFVGWLGLLLFARPRTPGTGRKFVAALSAAALAMAANVGFNYFRYGVAVNLANLVPEFQVPSLAQHLNYLAALVFSPNGGVFFFVPLFLPLLAGLPWTTKLKWPGVLVATAFGILLAGLSKWYSPFGWVTWGPRLLLPWLPAFAFVLLESYPASLGAMVRALTRSVSRWRSIGLFFLILGVAHFAAWLSVEAIERWFAPGLHCERVPIIQADPAYFYTCVNGALWTFRHWFLGYAFESAFRGPRILFSVLYIGLFWAVWRRLRTEAETR